MKIFVTFTLVLLIMCSTLYDDALVMAEGTSKKGEDCFRHNRCEEGTYCSWFPTPDESPAKHLCEAPSTTVGYFCSDIEGPNAFYMYLPCAEPLQCLLPDERYYSGRQCFTDEAQRVSYYAQKNAEDWIKYPCQGRNLECGEGGYCVKYLGCSEPSQGGEACQEILTAEYLEKHPDVDRDYYRDAPCAKGLVCRRNIPNKSKQVCMTEEAASNLVQKYAEELRTYTCSGKNHECGKGGYCVGNGSSINCDPPSQEGQTCEFKFTAEYLERHLNDDIYYTNAPCAEGLLCIKNYKTGHVCRTEEDAKILVGRYACRGDNHRCLTGRYCVVNGQGYLDCAKPSQDGQACKKVFTAEYLEKHLDDDIYYTAAPCAEGLLCLANTFCYKPQPARFPEWAK